MAFKNEVSVEFTAKELAALDLAFSSIEKIISGKLINLSPAERTAHARVGEGTQTYIDKSRGYMTQHPKWIDTERIDITELDKDFAARKALAPMFSRVQAIYHAFDDTHVLLGSDIFDACKAFYYAVKGKNDSNVPGAKAVYDDLKLRFPGRPKAVKIPPAAPKA